MLGFGGFRPRRSDSSGGTCFAANVGVHATFMQKVIICAVLGFLAAALVEWGKVFVEGADDALNGGYKQRTTDTLSTRP
jgi:hypothetical protein